MTQTEFTKLIEKHPNVKRANLKQVFFNADLRSGHSGLEALAKKNGVTLLTLKPGEFFIFINRKKTMFKMATAFGTTVAHFKTPNNSQLDLRMVKYLPTYFSGGELNYLGALKEVLGEKSLQ